MEFSLCLSFYLRHNLMSYVVGNTMGFPVEIVQALLQQSCYRIPWKCPQYHMSGYSAHRRVIGSGLLLNRGLGGYYEGNIPQVL
jgi:hypothetical protein